MDPGLGFGGVVAFREIAFDSASGSGARPGPAPVPEVGFSASAGFARADGTGPALRVSEAFGFPNIMAGDAYAQLPRIGPVIAGGGMLVTPPHAQEDRRTWVTSPYAMLGWERKDETMLYASMTWYRTRLQARPESTVTNVTARAIMIGLQGRRLTRDGRGSLSQRVFIGGFRSKRMAESIWGFPIGGQRPLRSLVLIGGSYDVAWSWSSMH